MGWRAGVSVGTGGGQLGLEQICAVHCQLPAVQVHRLQPSAAAAVAPSALQEVPLATALLLTGTSLPQAAPANSETPIKKADVLFMGPHSMQAARQCENGLDSDPCPWPGRHGRGTYVSPTAAQTVIMRPVPGRKQTAGSACQREGKC